MLVRELDRLSRNLAKQLIVEQELKRAGVVIEYVLGEYPDTPEGRLNKHIKATIAEYEREKIAERMARGRRLKVKAGNVLVYGRPPYGYEVLERNGKWALEAHKPEVRVVKVIFRWYTEGDGEGGPMSIREITKRLTEMKIPTWADKNGAPRKVRGYGVWSTTTVNNILNNEVYVGTWFFGKYNGRSKRQNPRETWIAVSVPSIVDQGTWERAQVQLKRNKEMASRNTKYPYLLARRVTCGVCACKMYGVVKRVKETVYPYYRCTSPLRVNPTQVCNLPHFRVDHVDAAVWEWARLFLTNPVTLAEGLRAQQAERERANAPLQERLAVVDDLLTDNLQQLERVLDLHLSGDFPKEILTERRTRLEKTITALERERDGLADQIEAQMLTNEQILSVQDFAAQVAEGMEIADADFETRRRVIEMLDVQVTLAVEDGEKIVYARCMLGKDVLPVAPNTICGSWRPKRGSV